MEVTDPVLADVAYLANLYPIQFYGLDVLEARVQTGEFYAID